MKKSAPMSGKKMMKGKEKIQDKAKKAAVVIAVAMPKAKKMMGKNIMSKKK